jgi:hypothetical protein
MKASIASLLLVIFISGPVAADSPSVSVKPIGALFLEPPPGREKNLVPFGVFGSQEKVEVHAIVMLENRLIADVPTFSSASKVNATATLPDKTQVPLGTATTTSFRKVSEDGKKTQISFSIDRLPDSGVSRVAFKGFTTLTIASSIKRTRVDFQPKVGNRLDVGLGNLIVSKVETDSLTFSGDDKLTEIAAVKIIKPDGSVIVGERGSYGRIGNTERAVVESQWRFNAPISQGKIEIAAYHELTTVEVPINLVVTKPY